MQYITPFNLSAQLIFLAGSLLTKHLKSLYSTSLHILSQEKLESTLLDLYLGRPRNHISTCIDYAGLRLIESYLKVLTYARAAKCVNLSSRDVAIANELVRFSKAFDITFYK